MGYVQVCPARGVEITGKFFFPIYVPVDNGSRLFDLRPQTHAT